VRGRTPWFRWRLRRSGTAVRFRATWPGIRQPLQPGPTSRLGPAATRALNLIPWQYVHPEGADTQDHSDNWRTEAATKEQQYQRQQDQHQATAPALHKEHRPNRQCQGNDHGRNAAKHQGRRHSQGGFTGKNAESGRIGPRLNQQASRASRSLVDLSYSMLDSGQAYHDAEGRDHHPGGPRIRCRWAGVPDDPQRLRLQGSHDQDRLDISTGAVRRPWTARSRPKAMLNRTGAAIRTSHVMAIAATSNR
jgi:hypothetical protein